LPSIQSDGASAAVSSLTTSFSLSASDFRAPERNAVACASALWLSDIAVNTETLPDPEDAR
jgi:hypothetical protein